jgi:hypothetical protein
VIADLLTARAQALVADVTSTVYATTTVTQTIVELEEGEASTEYSTPVPITLLLIITC